MRKTAWLILLSTMQSASVAGARPVAAQQCADVGFESRVLPLNGLLFEMHSADVNGDGLPDQVTFENPDREALRVWVRGPDARFGDPITVPLPRFAFGLASADADGDGSEEVLLVSADPPRFYIVSVDAGNARGEVAEYEAAGMVRRVVGDDLDGDGDVDLAISTMQGDLWFAENDGTGLFDLRDQPLALGGDLVQIAFGDLDGDGVRDALVTQSGSSGNSRFLIAMRRTGPFGFEAIGTTQTIAWARDPALVDVDADGDLDVVLGSDSSRAVTVHRNAGAGGLAAPEYYFPGSTSLSARATSLQVFDANADGLPDVAFVDVDRDLHVMLNQGGGVYADWDVPVPGWNATAIALDGSGPGGSVRLAVATTDRVRFVESDPDGRFFGEPDRPERPAGGRPRRVLSADLNADGTLDLLTINTDPRAVAVHLADGDGGFLEPVLLEEGLVGDRMAAGDVSGDGVPDIVVEDSRSGAVRILLNDGSGGFQPGVEQPFGSGLASIRIADLDGDGRADLFGANVGSGLISYALNLGTGEFGFPINIAGGDGLADVLAADADGDGATDLVASHTWDREIAVYPNLGSGLFGAPIRSPTADPLDRLELADIDGDGDLDAVARHAIDRTIVLADQLGGGVFSGGDTIDAEHSYGVVRLGDLDGDGDADIAASVPDSNEFAVVERLDVGWGRPKLYAATSSTADMILSDLDDDSRPDVVWCDAQSRRYEIRRNTGDCPLLCPADIADPQGTVDFFDIAAFVSMFAAGDPAADLASPFGVLNFFDVLTYIELFNEPCL
ncbi:MAG: VCBS repeat-containing protein [Planctomycetota bacterium]